MKIAQMYALMLMLLSNKKLTREYAAERLEVSERTVQRYVEDLCGAGVPIVTHAGRAGGYSIADDYKLPYTLFTSDELERITTSIGAMSRSFGDELSGDLLDKLMSVSGGGRQYTMPSVIIDAGAWNNPEALRGKLDAVGAAIDQQITVNIEYTDKIGQPTKRLLDPYCLALKEGIWYVYGWCHVRSGFRIFRLARMRSILLTGDNYEKRSGANVNEALSVNIARDLTLKIEFGENALARVEEWLGEDAIKASGGTYTATAMVADGDELIAHLLSLGKDVSVLSPRGVQAKLFEAAAGICAKYQKS